MNHHKSELYFLFAFLVAISVLVFFIFKPFLYAIILAVVFSTVFSPVHNKILNFFGGKKKSLSALLSTVAILIVFIVPTGFLGVQIFQESSQLYSSLRDNGISNLSRSLNQTLSELNLPIPKEYSTDLNQYLSQGLDFLIGNLDSIFSNIAKIAISIFIFLVALYYFFKDGQKLKKLITTLSPLQDVHDKAIFDKLTIAINSVIKGNLIVALAQGLLTALGFFIFGVPHPVLWGSAAAIASLVPGIGTALVLSPAIMYLFIINHTASGIGLLSWGIVAVGLVDNILGPVLVERGTKLHPFLVLLSILGGVGFFGPIGFLLGPLVLSLFFALLEIYFSITKQHAD